MKSDPLKKGSKKKKKNKFLTISKTYLPLQSQQTGRYSTDVETSR